MAKIVSLIVKIGALIFIIALPLEYAIQLQLLGGIWIIQILPAVMFGLYTRFLNAWALLAGWAVGMGYGTVKAYQVINPATGKHFGGSLDFMPVIGDLGYIAVTAFVLNLLVAVVLTLALGAAKVSNGRDATEPGDYYADAGDPRVDADLAHVEDQLTREVPERH